VIEENGAELEIVRNSFPYGTANEAGLFLIVCTRDLGVPERMLGPDGDGPHDRLLEFTRAVSGASFFAPSEELLRRLVTGSQAAAKNAASSFSSPASISAAE